MNEELQEIKDIAGWSQSWYPIATAMSKLATYVGRLEERIARQETNGSDD
jgi:hypothetical protein